MAIEQYKNFAKTQLNGSINDSTTSVVVDSAALFPTTGNFRIVIDQEIMLVTAVAGTTFTVTRGHEGTVAAGHADDVNVTHILTAGSLPAVASNIIGKGTYAARPAAGAEGELWLPTDAPVISRDTGSAWENWGTLYRFTPPPFADFAWVNQGDAVATDKGWATQLSKSGDGNASNWRSWVKSTPAAPWTLTVYMDALYLIKGNVRAGLILRESSTGELIFFGHGAASSTTLMMSFLAGDTSTTSTSGEQNFPTEVMPKWLRITDDNTNLVFSCSVDGDQWFQVYSEGRTARFATGANQFGITLNTHNVATPNRGMIATVYHWAVT